MWWFHRSVRKDIWDEEIRWPIGDIEAAHRIREICRSAAGCAATTAAAAAGSDKEKKPEAGRYQRAARVAMEIAIRISDGLLRDSSVRQIVGLSMAANDLKTARILFRAIQAASIREDVVNDHPELRSDI